MGSISTTLFIWILDFDSGLHCVQYTFLMTYFEEMFLSIYAAGEFGGDPD